MAKSRSVRSIDVVGERPLQLYVTYRLTKVSAKLNRQAGAVLKRAGNLNVPEWRILALLSVHGEMSGSAIGNLVGLDPGQVSRTFRKLEARNCVVLRRSDDDRRNVFVSLTRAGRTLHAKVSPSMRRRQERLLAVLAPQEYRAFLDVLDKLEIAADAHDFPEAER